MRALVIILLIILVLGIIGAIVYFIQTSPPASSSPPSLSKINAVCRGEIKDEYYTFKNESKLGSDIIESLKEKFSFIKNYIKHFLVKEKFALSSGIIENPTMLDLRKYYQIGTLNTSNILSEPKNGGINDCPTYPNIVYKQI